jgi:hypothetical protein
MPSTNLHLSFLRLVLLSDIHLPLPPNVIVVASLSARVAIMLQYITWGPANFNTCTYVVGDNALEVYLADARTPFATPRNSSAVEFIYESLDREFRVRCGAWMGSLGGAGWQEQRNCWNGVKERGGALGGGGSREGWRRRLEETSLSSNTSKSKKALVRHKKLVWWELLTMQGIVTASGAV